MEASDRCPIVTRSPIASFVLTAMLAACAKSPATAAQVHGAESPAASSLADVEAKLLAAPAWRAEVAIVATGAIAANLEATVLAARDGRVQLRARGELFGQPADLVWTSDGARTSRGAPAPKHAVEAVVIGMVRMGILHNLARISTGRDPDHADGGASQWVIARAVRHLPDHELSYRLAVAGKDSADVVVGLDPRGGPVLTHRRIVVHFDQGDMTVEETYRFDFSPDHGPDTRETGRDSPTDGSVREPRRPGRPSRPIRRRS